MGSALEFTNGALPSREDFFRLLQEASEQYDPVDKLLALDRELIAFEQKHGMASALFFLRFEAGELGDALDFIRWAGRYELYLHLKTMISASLDLVVTQPNPVYA